VLLFALALAVVTALLFGLGPAMRLSQAPQLISTMLSVGGRSGTPPSKRTGQWPIAVEVALALVLSPDPHVGSPGQPSRQQVHQEAPLRSLAAYAVDDSRIHPGWPLRSCSRVTPMSLAILRSRVGEMSRLL